MLSDNELKILQYLLIRKLQDYETSEPELISLYINKDKPISEIINMLSQELQTQNNMLRKAVQNAINKLESIKEIPENGIAIFCSPTKCYSITPVKKINQFFLNIDNRFHTEQLEEMLKPD